MKKWFLYIVLSLAAAMSYAQQTPLYSMYTFNEFAYNPAVAGLKDYYQAQVNNRYQFVGIENAPITATISLTGKLNSHPMGWGGMIYNDSQGAFSKFGVYGAYAYHLRIGTFSKLSLGLNVGVIRYSIDMTKIQFMDTETNLNESLYQSTRPDASFGVYYDMRHYFIGASVDQLFNNRIEIYNDTLALDNTLNRFKSHLNIMTGGRYKMLQHMEFEPTIFVRKVYASPWQIEFSGRITYRDAIWAGASYRSQDAVVLFLGYTYRDMLSFGYSYDITYSKLRNGSRGAHEFFLAINFKQTEKE